MKSSSYKHIYKLISKNINKHNKYVISLFDVNLYSFDADVIKELDDMNFISLSKSRMEFCVNKSTVDAMFEYITIMGEL